MFAPCCWLAGIETIIDPHNRVSPSPRQVGFGGIDLLLRACRIGMNGKFEHVSWYRNRYASIRDVDDAPDTSLDRRTAEDDIGLLLRESEFRQIIDGIKTCPPHRHGGVIIELLARLVVDAHALEHQEIAIM